MHKHTHTMHSSDPSIGPSQCVASPTQTVDVFSNGFPNRSLKNECLAMPIYSCYHFDWTDYGSA
jgi:hypothetical protein